MQTRSTTRRMCLRRHSPRRQQWNQCNALGYPVYKHTSLRDYLCSWSVVHTWPCKRAKGRSPPKPPGRSTRMEEYTWVQECNKDVNMRTYVSRTSTAVLVGCRTCVHTPSTIGGVVMCHAGRYDNSRVLNKSLHSSSVCKFSPAFGSCSEVCAGKGSRTYSSSAPFRAVRTQQEQYNKLASLVANCAKTTQSALSVGGAEETHLFRTHLLREHKYVRQRVAVHQHAQKKHRAEKLAERCRLCSLALLSRRAAGVTARRRALLEGR